QPNQPFTVTLHMIDNANRPVSAVGIVTLSLAQNPAGDTLAGTTTATLSAGAATFSVQLAKPARGVQLRAACSGGCPSAGNSDAFTVQMPRFAAPLGFNPSQRSVAEGVAVNLDWLLDGTPAGLSLLGPSTYGAPLASAVPLALAGPISTIPFPAATAPGTSATYRLRTSSDSFAGWLPDPPVPPTRLPVNLTPAGMATLPDGTLALIAQAAGDFVFKGMTSTALSSGADCVVLHFLDSNFVLGSIQRFGAPGATCQPLAVAAARGGAGDLYVSGNYSGSIPFGAQTISSECGANCQQGFVLKLTVAGTVPWVSHFGPASSTNWAGANLNTLEALVQNGNDSGVAVYGSAGFAHVNTLPAAGGTINFFSGSTQTRQMVMPQAVFATLGMLDASGGWSFTGYGATQTARTFSSESPKGINSSSVADIAEASDGSLFVAFKSGIDVLGNAPPLGDNTAMTLTRGFATGYDGARNLTFQGATITSEGTDQVAPFSEDSILGEFAGNSPSASTLVFCGDRNVACNKLAALPGGGVLMQGSTLLTTVAFPPISLSTSPAVLDDGSVDVSDRQFVVQLDSALRGISGGFISTFDVHDSFDEVTPVPSKLFAGPDGGFALLGSTNGLVTFGLLDEQRQSVGGSPRPGQQWPFIAWFGPDARLRWVDSMPGASFAGMLLLPDQTMLVVGQSSSPATFGGADWDPANLPAGPFLGPLGGANYKSLVVTQSP
ncbi:MAG TPA: hypothetical protein VH083_28125, partial [Myxococcales bacterium]|nr:hypothetical protein [Myxococcales bacterium]